MKQIKALREAAGLTQKDLADLMGVDRTAVAKWEAGAAFPSGAKIPQLAEALKCQIADLFDSEKSATG